MSPLPPSRNGRRITVPEDGFSVEMPGRPQHRINLQDPELFAGVSEHGADLAPGFVMVSVFMFVPEKRALLSDDEILNLGAAMIPPGCRETESGPIAGGPGAARAVTFACPDDVTLAYRLHLYGDRLYRLAAGGPRGAAESDAADRFFAPSRSWSRLVIAGIGFADGAGSLLPRKANRMPREGKSSA